MHKNNFFLCSHDFLTKVGLKVRLKMQGLSSDYHITKNNFSSNFFEVSSIIYQPICIHEILQGTKW